MNVGVVRIAQLRSLTFSELRCKDRLRATQPFCAVAKKKPVSAKKWIFCYDSTPPQGAAAICVYLLKKAFMGPRQEAAAPNHHRPVQKTSTKRSDCAKVA